jgi:flagellar M-ring protein FliF
MAPLATTSIAGPQRESSSTITNYEISKTIEHIIKSPSSIKSISVSVVVDGTYKLIAGPDGKSTREYVPRSEEEIEKYRRLVLAAVGNPTARNAEIINVPLDASAVEWERQAVAKVSERRDLYFAITKGAATIAVLLFIFLLVRYILKQVLPVLVLPETKAGERGGVAAKEEFDVIAEVKEMAEERPDDLASLIKVWVKEEE